MKQTQKNIQYFCIKALNTCKPTVTEVKTVKQSQTNEDQRLRGYSMFG